MEEHPPTLAEQMQQLREAVRECGRTIRDTPGFWLYLGGVWLIFLAFAVVSTNGVGGVPVRLENRVIGVTDDDGMLLVTPLLSWQRNRISIDTLELPADMRADRVDTLVTPRQSAGLGVSFGLRRTRAITLVLHDAQDRPVPAGSQVRLPDQRSATVGYDGEVYLEDLPAQAVLQVDTDDGRCEVRVPVSPAPGSAALRLGPLRCVAGAGP